MSSPSLDFLESLIAIDSPTGMTKEAAEFLSAKFTELGWFVEQTRKGALRVRASEAAAPRISFAAHFDTLGAIVEEVCSDGTLALSQLGGYPYQSFEGAHCRVYTRSGEIRTGTYLFRNPSSHADSAVSRTERTRKNMRVRLDYKLSGAADTRELGIEVGDFVAFEPDYRVTESGFVKSRFLDNKAGCLCLYDLAKRLGTPSDNIELYFSNYEEVGHGGAPSFPASVEELMVLDMGVIGEGVNGLEDCVSICAKDSTGPYDFEMRKMLQDIADEEGIESRTAIYPFYGSDGSAALRAGNDLRVALIGPGVSASHGVERSHRDAFTATTELCLKYLERSGYLK